ncbi:hypothetical protein B1A_17718, partial [mine drainage metagenome]
FTDKEHNSFRYSETLIEWFKVWGIEVDRSSNPGPLERSFIQTNWCDSQSKSAAGISDDDYRRTELFKLIKQYQPRAIVLTAVSLFPRFRARAAEAGIRELKDHEQYLLKTATGKQFRAWLAEYDKTNVLAVPHPSRFASILGKSVAGWKQPARYALSKVIDIQSAAYKPLRL